MSFPLFVCSLRTAVRVLGQNQSHNQTIQRQSFTKNEHDKHTNVQFVGTFCRRLVGFHRACHVFTIVVTQVSTSTPIPFTSILRLDTIGTHAGITQNSNRSTSSETRQTTAKTSCQLWDQERGNQIVSQCKDGKQVDGKS